MKQPITGYQTDDGDQWVAQLACGHNQHVRHNPPLSFREWTQTAAGRESMLGFELKCVKCDDGAPRDRPNAACQKHLTDCDLATSVPDWIIEYPQLLPLFQELGIEYCCGGKSLEAASREQNLDPQIVLAKLVQQLQTKHSS